MVTRLVQCARTPQRCHSEGSGKPHLLHLSGCSIVRVHLMSSPGPGGLQSSWVSSFYQSEHACIKERRTTGGWMDKNLVVGQGMDLDVPGPTGHLSWMLLIISLHVYRGTEAAFTCSAQLFPRIQTRIVQIQPCR